MKYQITTKNMVSTVALLALVTMTSSYTQEHEPHATKTILKSFSESFYKIEKKVSSFFNSNDKTPYTTYCAAIEKDILDYTLANQTITRSPHDKLATAAHDVAEYARQIMSAILGVMKKYIGKSASLEQAKNFEKDLKAVFNPEVVFKTMIAKLEILKKLALADGHNDIATQITTIIKMIEQKRKEWNAKKEYELFVGLTTRMSC